MYQTMSTATAVSTQNTKFRSILKGKLSYEWKNIYRQLSSQDKTSLGSVTL